MEGGGLGFPQRQQLFSLLVKFIYTSQLARRVTTMSLPSDWGKMGILSDGASSLIWSKVRRACRVTRCGR